MRPVYFNQNFRGIERRKVSLAKMQELKPVGHVSKVGIVPEQIQNNGIIGETRYYTAIPLYLG